MLWAGQLGREVRHRVDAHLSQRILQDTLKSIERNLAGFRIGRVRARSCIAALFRSLGRLGLKSGFGSLDLLSLGLVGVLGRRLGLAPAARFVRFPGVCFLTFVL